MAEYHEITWAIGDAEDALKAAFDAADDYAGECDGQYEGMNETARRLKALLEKFKADCEQALQPIIEDIKKYDEAEANQQDEPSYT